MIFNEILVPQESFTETNVTRKRSVVGKFESFFEVPNSSFYFFIYFKKIKIFITSVFF